MYKVDESALMVFFGDASDTEAGMLFRFGENDVDDGEEEEEDKMDERLLRFFSFCCWL